MYQTRVARRAEQPDAERGIAVLGQMRVGQERLAVEGRDGAGVAVHLEQCGAPVVRIAGRDPGARVGDRGGRNRAGALRDGQLATGGEHARGEAFGRGAVEEQPQGAGPRCDDDGVRRGIDQRRQGPVGEVRAVGKSERGGAAMQRVEGALPIAHHLDPHAVLLEDLHQRPGSVGSGGVGIHRRLPRPRLGAEEGGAEQSGQDEEDADRRPHGGAAAPSPGRARRGACRGGHAHAVAPARAGAVVAVSASRTRSYRAEEPGRRR